MQFSSPADASPRLRTALASALLQEWRVKCADCREVLNAYRISKQKYSDAAVLYRSTVQSSPPSTPANIEALRVRMHAAKEALWNTRAALESHRANHKPAH